MIWTSRVLCSFWDANNKAQVGLLERYNHTSAIHQDKFMYLYGGLVIEHGGENSATSATTTNSFLRYNLETGEYQTLNEFIAPNFSLPSLSHHTMTVINNKMYIYGGKDRSDNPCGEVYTFDLTKEDWTKVITTSFSNTPTTPKKMDFKNYNDPTKRYGHTAVAVENSIYVFGGTDGKNYYNDIRVFDTGAYSWVTVKTHGPAPTPRSGHSCVLYGTNTLFVFGGGNDFKLFNDLYSFSMDTVTWTKITTKGSLEPVKRIHHTANVLANKMILFGGIVGDQDRQHDLMLLDLEDFRWDVSTIKQDTSTCPPSGLNAHTSALSDSSKMWVVGGKSGDTVSGLVYTLETGISVMVDPIDFGRSNLPNDLLVAVDNTCMYYDLKMNYANRTYHLHRAMLRIRCPALYQEYLRMVRANLADQPIDFESTIKKIQRRRSQPTCTQQQVSEYSQDVIFYLMEFIYTDGVSILENDEQVDNNTLSQLHTLANVLDLTRLESLISNYSNMTVPIPPPTIFADMHSLLRLCELESPVVHALDSIFDTHHDPDQDNDSNHDDDDEEEEDSNTFSIQTPMSSVSNLSVSTFVERILPKDSNHYTDVSFHVTNGQESGTFGVHRFILLARSKFFRRMFSNGSVQDRVVEINGIRPIIFKLVLEYLYVGNVTVPYEIAVEVLIAAEVYELTRLSLMAQSTIERKLHVHNVCKMLNIADSYDIEHLRHACVFFVAHHLSQVKKTTGYRRELNKDLKMELKRTRKEVRAREEALDEPGNEEFLFPHSTFYHDKYHSKKKAAGVKKGKKKAVVVSSKRRSREEHADDYHHASVGGGAPPSVVNLVSVGLLNSSAVNSSGGGSSSGDGDTKKRKKKVVVATSRNKV